jgi:hypothetical protein
VGRGAGNEDGDKDLTAAIPGKRVHTPCAFFMLRVRTCVSALNGLPQLLSPGLLDWNWIIAFPRYDNESLIDIFSDMYTMLT